MLKSISFGLLGLMTAVSATYIIRRHLWKHVASFCLHLSFVLILAGAMVTHLWGEQGRMHLRAGILLCGAAMLVYSLGLHAGSLKWFRKPMNFHLFCILAFISVLITYFGVNFLLGGLHSYA